MDLRPHILYGRFRALTDDKVTDLFKDQQAEVVGDDFVIVAVANDGTVTIWYDGALLTRPFSKAPRYRVAFLRRDCGYDYRTEMEEDEHLRRGVELLQEVDEDSGCGRWRSRFVEEDADTIDSDDRMATEGRR